MGLIWSQIPDDVSGSRDVFAPDYDGVLVTDIVARFGDGRRLNGSFRQYLALEGVTRHEIRDEGMYGVLFRPAKSGPYPVVIILNGSGGGVNEPRAALYASHGYAAFALGYFNVPGRSPYISNTHLEYFETVLNWVHRELRPLHGFVALNGQSRGGELVLLLGSLFPNAVSAVVGYVPGAVVHSAQNACDPSIGRDGPTWIYRGEPLPHLWENNRTANWAPWDEGPSPRRHANAVLTALGDSDAVARARIPVEKFKGPVLLLSGSDDGSWPSSLYSRMVAEHLKEVDHPYPVEHHDYEGAGHSILFPYVPTTQLSYAHPVSGRVSSSGGTAAANAVANEESWAAVLRFLRDALHDKGVAAT